MTRRFTEAELAVKWGRRTRAGMPRVYIGGHSEATFELRDGKIVRVTRDAPLTG